MHATPRRHTQAQKPPSRTPWQPRLNAGTLWIWGVFGLCAVLPALTVLGAAVRGFTRNVSDVSGSAAAPSPATLATSAIYAALIALLALVFAWPVAIAASRAPRRWLLALATPMLLPSYLAHAGWSILRAPTTPLGRWIGAAPEHGLEWLPIVVGRAVAVWGLALWSFPLAAIVIAIGLRSLGRDLSESLRLERSSALRRSLTLARAAWPSVGAAALLVMLLMLGSAVPLHIARIETAAIRVWVILDEHPAEPWLAWIAAWPLLVVALGAGALLSGPLTRLGRALAANGESAGDRVPWPAAALAGTPWFLAMAVPFTLFLWSLESTRPLVRFVRDAGEGILSSATVAACVGLIGGTLALGASQAVARGTSGPKGQRALLALALAAGLTPGILVGSAVAHMTRSPLVPQLVAESAAPVVIAHTARFAFLPLLIGIWLGANEADNVAQLRGLDGADSLEGWAKTSLPSQWPTILAASLATGCLSFHEIEASIQVQPPGLDHLPQRLLQWLHYERLTELSAAGVFLLAIGIAVSAAIVLAAGRPRTLSRIYR